MRSSPYISRRLRHFAVLFVVAFAVNGCAIKLVPDYYGVTFEEIIKVGKKVDRFYGDVLETKSTDRPYQKFSERYVDIETDIRSLVTRNRARALNELLLSPKRISWNARTKSCVFSGGTAK